jgi:putative transport protein
MPFAALSEFLHHRPLFVLFSVAASGFLLGKLRLWGFSFGVAAVLFSGLFLGALVPGVELPEFVPQLGLVLFVYTLGLASGPGFFASLRRRGLKDNALALGVVVCSFFVTLTASRLLGLRGADAAGMFAGAITNTPALAGVVDALRRSGAKPEELSAPVIAYSVCYPLGVLIPLLGVWLSARVFGVSYQKEQVPKSYATLSGEPIINATVLIASDQTRSAHELRLTADWSVVFGRFRRAGLTSIVHDETRFAAGDLVTVIGSDRDVLTAARALGSVSSARIDQDRSQIDYRRMFVSNPALTGRPLRELSLIHKYDAVITRVRRGDVDLVPNADFELQLGDRTRVLAAVQRMPDIQKLFGDSLQKVAEIDIITFSLGIAIGLLLGSIPIPLPGGGTFELGMAGGPLIAGLVLGRIGRSGPLVWLSPFGANLTLRQFGLVLFLSGIGLRSGHSFASALGSGSMFSLVLAGALLTSISVAMALFVGHRLLRIPLSVMVGTLSGIHTQPAVLAFALEKSGKDLPNIGYTTVFPLATIAKIVLGQALLFWIR